MMEYPGCHYYSIAYVDEEVVIRRAFEAVHVYHKCEYKTPLKGELKCEWLCSGIWKIGKDNRYHQQNGIGLLTGVVLDTVNDIANFIKKGE